MHGFIRHIACLLVFACSVSAADLRGTVLDPSRAAVAGAQVVAMGRTGVLAQTVTGASGAFTLRVPDAAAVRLVVTAPGFATRTVSAETDTIQLEIAAQVDTIRVSASTLDVPLSEQGNSTSVILREEIASRNEPLAADLLRYLPGITVNQTGPRGSTTSLFVRGGDSNFNLVQIDGVPVNAFGGAFDFAHIPTDWLDRVEVIRGPESAVYGSYANASVVNFVTRTAPQHPTLDVITEGGTYGERRFGVGGSGTLAGFGIAGFASSLDSDGPVRNNDYRNRNLSLSVNRAFARQSLSLRGRFNQYEIGEPGPYGSDPLGYFAGLDTYSRSSSNLSSHLLRYQADLTPRVRQELTGAFFQNNAYYRSGWGDSFNRDLRGHAETRTVVSVTDNYTTSFGFAYTREDEKNSWITDSRYDWFPLRRTQQGIYWENRVQVGSRLFLDAGARAEVIHTGALAENPGSGRPAIRARTITRVNPKVAAAYLLAGLRLHASFGAGIRPPSGTEMAFTNNPALRPERTMSFDFGVERRLLSNRLGVEATWFHNRFSDLIVSLGGSLATLSAYRSDNLANSRARGVEFTARAYPRRSLSFTGTYTWLQSEILSLDGSSGVAQAYFRVGQHLLRRPAHSGTLVSTWRHGRLSANLTGYWRGETLDVEPNLGASAGLFRNPGYFNMGINLNCRVASNVTVYGNLRNALNRRYEESFGYPAPLLNFVAGMKFTFERGH